MFPFLPLMSYSELIIHDPRYLKFSTILMALPLIVFKGLGLEYCIPSLLFSRRLDEDQSLLPRFRHESVVPVLSEFPQMVEQYHLRSLNL